MAEQTYESAVKMLKAQLSKYSHSSVLNAALSYLGRHGNDQAKLVQGMPWVIMFLLKMSMLGEGGKKEITSKQFEHHANYIFHMQAKAARLDAGEVELKLRQMFLAQGWYQKTSLGTVRELLLLGLLFTREDNYYDDLFEATYGLSLSSYVLITMFVFVRVEAQEKPGVIEMPIIELIYFLCPVLPYKHVLAYVRLVSCEARHLPGFIELHDLGGEFESEYFQESPFKYVPFILQGDGLIAFNGRFTSIALSQLAPAVFKRDKPAFKTQFGEDFERRVGILLEGINCDSLISEAQLARLLKDQGIDGKLIDYVVREGDDVTLVECKAADPTDLMKCTAEPAVLKRGLQDNLIYSIHQGQCVVDALSKLANFKSCKFRQLTVTYGDFFLFGGDFVARTIDPGIKDEIEARYGSVPLALDRVGYLSFPDFAALTAGLQRNGSSLALFLDQAFEAQKDPLTMRFTLGQVVEEKMRAPGSYAAALGEQIEAQYEAMQTLLTENPKYWRGKSVLFLEKLTSFLATLHA